MARGKFNMEGRSTQAPSARGGEATKRKTAGVLQVEPGILRDGSIHPRLVAAALEGEHLLARAERERERNRPEVL